LVVFVCCYSDQVGEETAEKENEGSDSHGEGKATPTSLSSRATEKITVLLSQYSEFQNDPVVST